ncbi:MAG: PTS sugar transporter subunit IIA [Erysipelotrichaceae bacterium]|nr:PTS sugar transporter subunit IIA [Erysipelotrichaceae bacterium]MBQ5553687.1 PTS sugar transporter subunit IIA [Erysipelotrichaceae bacterium]
MNGLYVINGAANDWSEAIRLTSGELYRNGCVKEEFYEKCCERERDYPTGLTEFCPVAIPHASKDYVLKQAICVLRLKEPVKFRSMSDVDKEIDIRYVLNLALLDDSDHIKIISQVITCLKDKEFLVKMDSLEGDDLKGFLVDNFFKGLS